MSGEAQTDGNPTCEDLMDLDPVYRESDPGWRHGTYEFQVFEWGNTFWAASFRLSVDGETNELREGYADLFEVEPEEITVVRYKRKTA